jgi:hypothetical protein
LLLMSRREKKPERTSRMANAGRWDTIDRLNLNRDEAKARSAQDALQPAQDPVGKLCYPITIACISNRKPKTKIHPDLFGVFMIDIQHFHIERQG